MVFGMKGGVSRAIIVFFQQYFFKQTFRIIPWLSKRALHTVWALYILYTHSSWGDYEYGSQQLRKTENVNLEPIIRGLKNDNFDWDQV